MLQIEVLVREFIAINALATSAIMICEVTALAHKSWDNAVKGAVLETKSLLTSTQSPEIFCKTNV